MKTLLVVPTPFSPPLGGGVDAKRTGWCVMAETMMSESPANATPPRPLSGAPLLGEEGKHIAFLRPKGCNREVEVEKLKSRS